MTEDPVTRIMRRDPRYARAAYDFVRHALQRAVDSEEPQHVDARQLLESIRDLAREQFGPLARTVLHDWGVNSTDDFGNVVFNLIDAEQLGKTDDDSISDFAEIYDFDEAFPPETGEVRVRSFVDDWDDDGDEADDEA